MDTIIVFAAGAGAGLGIIIVWKLLFRFIRGGKASREVSVYSSIEDLKSIGELSVFKAYTKEIVTEVDHPWGSVGEKYMSWLLSVKKMAMIFEFEIDFRYNLRNSDFIIEEGSDCYIIKMPACFHELNIRDIHFYDEQRSRVLPLLIGDFAGNLIDNGFSEQEKNRLKNDAKTRAQEKAKEIIGKLTSEVESSARVTLESLAKSLGAERVEFDFKQSGRDYIDKVNIQKKPDPDEKN